MLNFHVDDHKSRHKSRDAVFAVAHPDLLWGSQGGLFWGGGGFIRGETNNKCAEFSTSK